MGSSPTDPGPGRQYLGFIFIRWVIFPSGELSYNRRRVLV